MSAKILQFPDRLARRQVISPEVRNLALADEETVELASEALRELDSVDEALRKLEWLFVEYRKYKGVV